MKPLNTYLTPLFLFLVLSGNIFATGIETSASSILENKARYSHNNLIDNDIFTTWAENATGPGIGEWVQLTFDTKKELHYLGIVPGYTKYNDKVGEVWFKNNRVKQATLLFSDGSSKQIEIADSQQMQYFPIHKHTSFVRIRIEDVHKTLRWDDTCIAEIKPIFDNIDSLQAELDFSHTTITDQSNSIYGLLSIKAPFKEITKRKPIHLTLVIDVSGSMAETDHVPVDYNQLQYGSTPKDSKLYFVKEAVKLMLASLQPEDTISIVSYSSSVQVVMQNEPIKNKNDIVQKVNMLFPYGGTNINEGLKQAVTLAKKHHKKKGINRIILLSDGMATVGEVNHKRIIDNLKSFFKRKSSNTVLFSDISVSSFGVGVGFDEDLMTEISSVGDGNYYFINNPREMFMNFHSEMTNLTKQTYSQLSVNIPKSDIFEIESAYGHYLNSSHPKFYQIVIPPMILGEKKDILFKIKVKENSPNLAGSYELNYFENETKKSKKLAADFSLLKDKLFKKTKDQRVNESILSILSGVHLRQSIKSFENGKIDAAVQKIKTHITMLKSENQYLQSAAINREIMILNDIQSGLLAKDYSNHEKSIFIKSSKKHAYDQIK